MNINADTKIFGIIGHPLGHSFSPQMHNAAFRELDYNAVYLPFPTKHLTGLRHSLNQFNVQGLSVTIPYKIKIRKILNKIDPLALKIGSVNTVKRNKAGLLEGYNTDGIGAVHSMISAGLKLKDKKILIIGSGGAARAIIFSLLEQSVSELGILARSRMKARILKDSILLNHPSSNINIILLPKTVKKYGNSKKMSILETPEQIARYDCIINTTPLGMKNYAELSSPIPENFLNSHQVVFDIVYNPKNTLLLKFARRKRLGLIYGYKMLLYQGMEQFKIFTGLDAPEFAMERALLSSLNAP